ncbi:unnamed protein product [Phytophthora fragariaefolia]|uniref:Unnamed protein product n=1 Tax=Phytophthora fragariaefolia TaxID=1490495 RepID=A0A9W6XIZ0_9STRA|nr:unnamed protein product [Phytophthora fragariaefolia]
MLLPAQSVVEVTPSLKWALVTLAANYLGIAQVAVSTPAIFSCEGIHTGISSTRDQTAQLPQRSHAPGLKLSIPVSTE